MENINNNTEEWVNGALIISLRPGYNHMELQKVIGFRLEEYFNGKCKVALECALFLTKGNPTEIKKDIIKLKALVTSKQAELVPDIAIYSDKEQIFKRGFLGIPKLVIEVLDVDNEEKDLITKKEIYEQFSIPEYWIVSPMSKKIYVYILENDQFKLSGEYKFLEENIKSYKFEDLVLDIKNIELFDDGKEKLISKSDLYKAMQNKKIKNYEKALEDLNNDPKTLALYNAREDSAHERANMISSVKEEHNIEVTKKMLKLGVSVEIISKAIKIPKEQIIQIKKELES